MVLTSWQRRLKLGTREQPPIGGAFVRQILFQPQVGKSPHVVMERGLIQAQSFATLPIGQVLSSSTTTVTLT